MLKMLWKNVGAENGKWKNFTQKVAKMTWKMFALKWKVEKFYAESCRK